MPVTLEIINRPDLTDLADLEKIYADYPVPPVASFRDWLDNQRDADKTLIAGRFNEPIVKRLVSGALRALTTAGVAEDAVDVHWVPGSFELPQAAQHLARGGRYAAIVCVGCVIKGQTPHFDFVAGQAAAGIQRVALDTGVPATFGVITALSEDQALERSGGEVGNRGEEAAHAALEMAAFVQNARRHGKKA